MPIIYLEYPIQGASIISVSCTLVAFLLPCKMKPGVTMNTFVWFHIQVCSHVLMHITNASVLVVAMLAFYRITTTHIRRMKKGNIFSLFTPGRGVPPSNQWWGGYPHPRSGWRGYPFLLTGKGYTQPRSGQGVPLVQVPGQDGGTPGQDGGVPLSTDSGVPPSLLCRSQVRMGIPQSQVRIEGYPFLLTGGTSIPGQDRGTYPSVQVQGQDGSTPIPGQDGGTPLARRVTPYQEDGVPPIQVQVRIGVSPIGRKGLPPPIGRMEVPPVKVPGQDRGYFHARSGWGYPPVSRMGIHPFRSGHRSGQGGGTPNQNSIACTCYAVGGMPLAFMQEDFLVSFSCSYWRKFVQTIAWHPTFVAGIPPCGKFWIRH